MDFKDFSSEGSGGIDKYTLEIVENEIFLYGFRILSKILPLIYVKSISKQ